MFCQFRADCAAEAKALIHVENLTGRTLAEGEKRKKKEEQENFPSTRFFAAWFEAQA